MVPALRARLVSAEMKRVISSDMTMLVITVSTAAEPCCTSVMDRFPSQEKREVSTMLQLPAMRPALRMKFSTGCAMFRPHMDRECRSFCLTVKY